MIYKNSTTIHKTTQLVYLFLTLFSFWFSQRKMRAFSLISSYNVATNFKRRLNYVIRHIVFFKFNDSATDEDKLKLKQMLLGLKHRIPLIKELEVGTDIGAKHNSFDMALNTTFETMEDVEEYAIHPEHVKVVCCIKEICSDTCKTDYNF